VLDVLGGSILVFVDCVYLRLSRSNVRFRGVSRTINHQELAEVIGTGFICGYILSLILFFEICVYLVRVFPCGSVADKEKVH
jgi:hypothetical protein